MRPAPGIKLGRTDTTLDLSQRPERRWRGNIIAETARAFIYFFLLVRSRQQRRNDSRREAGIESKMCKPSVQTKQTPLADWVSLRDVDVFYLEN